MAGLPFRDAATKEVIVSAPVIVFLYDRTFVAGSFREAWGRRKGFYLALAATWVLLGCEFVAAADRGGTVRDLEIGVSWWTLCSLTQFPAVLHYLRLSVWPRPLIFDYGTQVECRNPWTIALGPALSGRGDGMLAAASGLRASSAARSATARADSGKAPFLPRRWWGRAAGLCRGLASFAILGPDQPHSGQPADPGRAPDVSGIGALARGGGVGSVGLRWAGKAG